MPRVAPCFVLRPPLACEDASAHRAPQVVARAHLLDEFALPLVVHLDASRRACLPRDIGTVGEVIDPLAVLPHEDDSCASPADVLNDRTSPAVHRGERLYAGDN